MTDLELLKNVLAEAVRLAAGILAQSDVDALLSMHTKAAKRVDVRKATPVLDAIRTKLKA
jgi:hypothetical protein